MNILDVQDKLKGLSEQQLVQEMQMPTGVAPQFLVLSEITRRKRMRDDYQNQQNKPQTTVAQEAVSGAGVPNGGLASMAQTMAPNSSIAQNTAAPPSQPMPVQGMYDGGMVRKMATGGPSALDNPMITAWVRAEAQRRGVTPEEVLASLGPTGNAMVQSVQSRENRNRMLDLEPVGEGSTFPTQSDLDQRYIESQTFDPLRIPPQSDLDRRFAEDAVSINSRPMQPQPLDVAPTFPPREGRVIGQQPTPSPMAPSLPPSMARNGMAPEMRDMPPPVDLDLTVPEAPSDGRTWGQRNIGDPLRDFFRPVGDAGRAIGAEVGDAGRAVGQYVKDEGPRFKLGSIPPEAEAAPREPMPPVSGDVAAGLGAAMDSDMASMFPEYGAATELQNPRVRNAIAEREDQSSIMDMLLPFKDMEPPAAGYSGPFGGVPNSPKPGMTVSESMTPESARKVTEELSSILDGTPAEGGAAPASSGASGGVGSAGGTGGSNSSTSVTGRGSGIAVGGAGAPTSYEQELRDAMARAEKRANQDKWLALAQVGLQLMASKEPTLGGAIGEAGLAGLQAFRGSRDNYENERLGLTKSLFELQQAQQRAAAAQRSAGAKATSGPSLKDIDAAINSLTVEAKQYDDQGNEVKVRVPADEADAALVGQLKAQRAAMIAGIFATTM